jgi:hypothetical protein
MEPVEGEMKFRFIIYTDVIKVERYRDRWWVHFDGSWESIGFDVEDTPFKQGDMVKITFEKADDIDIITEGNA